MTGQFLGVHSFLTMRFAEDAAIGQTEYAARISCLGLLGIDAMDPYNTVRRDRAWEMLRRMESVYSDHPDFDEAWA